MNEFNKMNRRDQEAYLMLPIINELKKLGGQASTNALKRAIVANDDNIPENTLTLFRTSKKGNTYLPFNYIFNFAITNLVMAEFIDRPKVGEVSLTEKGRKFNGSGKELSEQTYKLSAPKWQERTKKNKLKKAVLKSDDSAETSADTEQTEEDIAQSTEDHWKNKVLNALMNLTSAKFELLCRRLVKKMNVDIDESIGTKLTGDGGIDGYGYITTDDFRTSRVAIQAKRWSLENSISSPEIDKFRGAMDKFRAEYGIFITTSTFTRDAIKAAREGTRVITLIDGDRLLDLVAKYELYVTPVTITTYKLDDFFKQDN